MATARDDQSLWPPLKAIYDLTLTFEDTVLDILPDGILLLLSPVVLLHYLNRPVFVRQSPLLWIKLVISVALVGTEIASLVFRAASGNYRTETALPAASLELLAVITISMVVYVEHRHAIRGSALLGIYLFFGVIADIVKSRSFFLRPGLAPLGALAVASGVLRIILLGLQEIPKTQLLLDRQLQSAVGREATSGYWNRSFFVHLYPLLLSGFRGVLVLSDLSNLGPDFGAEKLYTQLKQYWKQGRRVSRNALFLSCICTWKVLFAAIILPRLTQSGFSLAQPFILYRAITVVGDDSVGNFERILLLLGTILSFGGATMSKTTTSHLHNRLVTRIRGALVAQMFDKSLRVSQSEAKKSAAITLMSADIEGIADGLPKLYELVMTLVDLSLGIFVLSLFVGQSCFFVLGPLAVSAIATYFLGNWIGAALVLWNKSIETRVSKTSKVIDQLKAIKMFGLNPIVSNYLQNLRELEMASSNKFRGLEAVAVVSVLCAEYLTPVVVIAAALFWNTFGEKMSAATVFPSLSMIVLIKDPLSLLLDGYPVLKAMFGCFRRIQNFLNLEERKDPRILRESPSPTAESQLLGYESPPLPIVEFSHAKIAPVGTQIPILNDVNFVLMPGSVTGVVGANGSGKSLLLQGILGEAELMDGNVYIGEADIALCGQTVWLRNGSVRDNIIGPLPYDEILFRKVLRCCLLDQDIEQLPGGADYNVGSGGSRLSGGQRQRVGLARALYARKALVLLDDVFSSLDRRTAISILFRLCGEDGILRELNCAVVFCTYLPECRDVADQLIVLDGNGHASVDIKSNREARMEMIRSLDSGKAIITEEDEAQEQERIRLSFEQQPEPAVGPTDPAKETPPKGDMGLYLLFIRPMGRVNVLLWSFTMLLASIGEMAPDVYMRLWIERDPGNDLYFIGYAAIAFLAVIIFVVGAAWMFVRLMPRASITLHQQLVDTVLRGTIGFLGTIDNGVIINRFSQDMTLMARALVISFLRTVSVFFTALIQAGIIASGSSYMAIILPIIAVAVFFIQLFYLRTSRQIRIFDLERKSPLYTHFQESSDGLIHIRAFGWQKQNLEHAFKLLDDSQKAFYYMYCVQLWLGLVLGLLSTLIAAILMASALFATKSTSETALGLSFLNLILFAKTLEQLLKTWTRLELAVGALARLRDFMNTTPQEPDQGRIPVPGNWPSMGNIELSSVTARYSDSEHRPATLKNISLSVDAGQKVGIVGRTGSGKSSLFLLLLGFLRYEGTIKIDGINISSIPLDELRSRVVTISQDQLKLEASTRVNLLPFTLNMSPIVTDEKKRQEADRQDIRLRELLIRLGIWAPLNDKGGLDAMLDDVGYSHGQMQLFCLARGILRCQDTGSKVVLVDEATSSVEEEMERNAQRVMKEYFADCTVLVIGHRKSSIRGVEFTVELSKGEVVHVDPTALDSDEGDFR